MGEKPRLYTTREIATFACVNPNVIRDRARRFRKDQSNFGMPPEPGGRRDWLFTQEEREELIKPQRRGNPNLVKAPVEGVAHD